MNLTRFIPLAFFGVLFFSPAVFGEESRKMEFAIAIHGGAGDDPAELPAEVREGREKSLRQALEMGVSVLKEGGTSLDAVEKVIRFLEDDPHFNAGRGAVFDAAGGHSLDASIMDGSNRACGAVAGLRTVKNPISLARLVMTRTRHVLLASEGADLFAKEMGVEQVEPDYFSTPRQRANWEKAKREAAAKAKQDGHKGTVGCVALDRKGNLAAGTSTGGLTNKKFGRVGDSPVVGAGTYADNATCGVSCTGVGEHFIRHAIAHDVSARMAYQGATLKDAVQAAIHQTLEADTGGLIAVDKNGAIVLDFNTVGMARAAADSSGRFEVKLGAK